MSVRNCEYVLANAGFETTCEAFRAINSLLLNLCEASLNNTGIAEILERNSQLAYVMHMKFQRIMCVHG